MRVTLQRIACILITLVILGFGIYELGYYLRPVQTDASIATIKTFHSMPENSFEVIGYGSSHIWRGLNPMELYNKYGIGAYNYGCNWQHLNTTLLFLKDSLLTQKPRVALIETYKVAEYLENQDLNGEIYYTTALKESEDKKQYLKQVFGDKRERYLSYYMPLSVFHENWTNITAANFKGDLIKHYGFYKTMGFIGLDMVKKVKIPDHKKFQQLELNPTSIGILDEMVKICRDNNIEIVFYTTPSKVPFHYSDAMKKYAADNGCVYLDLFDYIDMIGLDGKTDFSDAGHLNVSGANKVTDFLGAFLAAHYDLTDFRKVEGNIWEQNQNR